MIARHPHLNYQFDQRCKINFVFAVTAIPTLGNLTSIKPIAVVILRSGK
jgi:hypothetical protein